MHLLNDPSIRKQLAPSGWRVATWADVENLGSYLNPNDTPIITPNPQTPNKNIAKSMAYTQFFTMYTIRHPIMRLVKFFANGYRVNSGGANSTNGNEQGFYGNGSHAAYWWTMT